MKKIFLILIIFFLTNCNKSKTILICGDHKCINKDEAEQYFKENLSIEVEVINKNDTKQVDLVKLNLKNNQNNKREVTIEKNKSIKKDYKNLSNEEIFKIKKNLKNIKRNEKKLEKISKKKAKVIKKEINKLKEFKKSSKNNIVNKKDNNVVDICTILEKCSIDEISKYLLKQGKNKNFPDITIRQ